MNNMHTRVIVLHYSDADVKHLDKAMQDAIGRAVCYDLVPQENDTEQLVSICLDKRGEFTSAYYRRLDQYQTLDTSALRTLQPFVIGAVPYGTTYSFNS
jgi:hypothetical protein